MIRVLDSAGSTLVKWGRQQQQQQQSINYWIQNCWILHAIVYIYNSNHYIYIHLTLIYNMM